MKLTFPNVLLLVFVVLKLCGVISWPWWWVTFPLWALFPMVVAYIVIVTLVQLRRAA